MSKFEDILGTILDSFRIGVGATGVRLKNTAGTLSVRNAADTTDAALRAFRPKLELTASRSLVASDANIHLFYQGATPITVTIPSGIVSANSEIQISQLGAGTVTIAVGSGVTLNGGTGSIALTQNSSATIVFYGASSATAFVSSGVAYQWQDQIDDPFTRADGAVGNNWSVVTSNGLISILTNRLRMLRDAGVDPIAARPIGEAALNQEAIAYWTCSTAHGVQPMVRVQAGNTYYSVGIGAGAATNMTVFKNLSGSLAGFGVVNFAALTVGTNYSLRIRVTGASPTTIEYELRNETAGSSVTGVQTTTDSAAALQVAGRTGVATTADGDGFCDRFVARTLTQVNSGGGAGAIASVFGRTGSVTAQAGDYTSDLVAEGTTNLYHTIARARAAFSAGANVTIDANGVISAMANDSGASSWVKQNLFPANNSGDARNAIGLGSNNDANFRNLRSQDYRLGGDLRILPVAGGQSIVGAFWGLQLLGNCGNINTISDLGLGGRDDYCVIASACDYQRPSNDLSSVVVFAVRPPSWQTGGSLQEWLASDQTVLARVGLDGRIETPGITINGSNRINQFVSLTPTPNTAIGFDGNGALYTFTPSSGGTSFNAIAPLAYDSGTTNLSIALATQTASGAMSAADKGKLDGIATNATANSSDAFLRDRANHTGTQALNTISGTSRLQEIESLFGAASTGQSIRKSAAGTIEYFTPSAGGTALNAPVQLSVTATNTLSALPSAPSAAGRLILYVEGVAEFAVGTNPSYTVTGTAIAWNATNAGYSLTIGMKVFALVW